MNSVLASESFAVPMAPGGRPLFAGRALLESIDRHAARGSPWAAADRAQALCWVGALRVLSEILCLRSSQGAALADHDTLGTLLALPLFFDAKDASDWEAKRPWSSPEYGLNPAVAMSYGALLDSDRPSDAYQAIFGQWNAPNFQVWRAWLETSPLSAIRHALEGSADAIERWDRARPADMALPLERNILELASRLGLDDRQARAWTIVEIYGGLPPPEARKAWDLARAETPDGAGFLGLWDAAAGLPPGDLASLLGSGGPLARLGFCEGQDMSARMLAGARGGWADAWDEWTLGGRGRPGLRQAAHGPEGAVGSFLRPGPPSELPLSAWSHLGDLPARLLSALRSPEPARILLWGPPGTGKTQMAASLAEAAGLRAWEPLWPDTGSERQAERCAGAVAQAREFAAALPGSMLLVDECERAWSAPGAKAVVIGLLDRPRLAQVWIANSLANCDPALLRRFDAIVEAKEMPRPARHALARQFFADDDLAFRAAQALKTPASIVGAARWCHASEDPSWTGVRAYMAGQSAALQAAAEQGFAAHFAPVCDEGSLPPIAGNADLAALQERLADALAHPQRYAAMGASLPKGVLLCGPPGTGKTLFARHLARAVGAPMLAPDCAALAARPSSIRSLFNEARRMAPCLIFLDEADALLASPMMGDYLDAAKQQILNTFLTELDGVSPMEGVFVIAATHRPLRLLDKAALRAGRLSETLALRMPSKADRQAIWSAHLGLKPMADRADLEALASGSGGFSGAEIAEAVNRAALSCARLRKPGLEMPELLRACDEVYWGSPDGSMPVSDSERRATAIHEIGHALLAWKNGLVVGRVTARPRGESLGATQWSPREGQHSLSREALRGRVEMMLGGIAAEEVAFGHFSNGGVNDLRQAHDLMMHGLASAGLGSTLPSMAGGDRRMWSDGRRSLVEAEEAQAMAEIFASAKSWLEARRDLLEECAADLLERKELSGAPLEAWARKALDAQGCPGGSPHSPPARPRPTGNDARMLHAKEGQ